MFGDDWFGEASPDNALHTVDKGRWAYTPIMKAREHLLLLLPAVGWVGC